MKLALPSFQLAGIPVRIHWTFLLLVGWVALSTSAAGVGTVGVLANVALLVAVFVCVVLHELGHALAARRYGIETRDITLLPIGGVARLERLPRRPVEELVVALAGPAVNVVIVLALLPLTGWTTAFASLLEPLAFDVSLVRRLAAINVIMVAFNMLPAFPLDGGRVLRALLATRLSYTRATDAAAVVGKLAAVGFAVLGLLVLGNPLLALVGLFVYFAASQEARQVRVRERLRDLDVGDAMATRFEVVSPDTPLETIAHAYVAGGQADFPVVLEGSLQGVLREADLVDWMCGRTPGETAGDLARSTDTLLHDRRPLVEVLDRFAATKTATLPVVRNGLLVGLLTRSAVERVLAADGWGRTPSNTGSV